MTTPSKRELETNQRCVVLVPCGDAIAPACEASLRKLEYQGYEVRRIRGYSQIDVARNEIVTHALSDGFEETMWIDSDVGFEPEAIEQLRSHKLPIVSGIYPKKGLRAIASHALPGCESMQFGSSGSLYEIKYAAAGFLLVQRRVYEDIKQKLELPVCNERFDGRLIPFFQPMTVDEGTEPWYLGEDFAFCERARQAGYQVMADTTIRLMHFGQYGYSWEDAGGAVDRYADYQLLISDKKSMVSR